MARLDRISNNREVAQLAATLGREFDYDLLSAVVTIDEPTPRAELAKLVSAGMLYVAGEPPQCAYLFKHVLIVEPSTARSASPNAGDFIKRSLKSWWRDSRTGLKRNRRCSRSISSKRGR